MGKLTHIMFHCADTPEGVQFHGSDIIRWHTAPPPQGRGWRKVGYAGGWNLDGTFEILNPFDNDEQITWEELTYGAAGWNAECLHFYYFGGKGNRDTRTPAQRAAMATFAQMGIIIWPEIQYIGHNQVNSHKYCPSFFVPDWAKSIGIPSKNIDHKIYWKA
jgi:hypothetical protein